MIHKRGTRWTLFAAAVASFLYATLVDASPWAVGAFFASGGLWFWLVRRKMRELDAPRPK